MFSADVRGPVKILIKIEFSSPSYLYQDSRVRRKNVSRGGIERVKSPFYLPNDLFQSESSSFPKSECYFTDDIKFCRAYSRSARVGVGLLGRLILVSFGKRNAASPAMIGTTVNSPTANAL